MWRGGRCAGALVPFFCFNSSFVSIISLGSMGIAVRCLLVGSDDARLLLALCYLAFSLYHYISRRTLHDELCI